MAKLGCRLIPLKLLFLILNAFSLGLNNSTILLFDPLDFCAEAFFGERKGNLGETGDLGVILEDWTWLVGVYGKPFGVAASGIKATDEE